MSTFSGNRTIKLWTCCQCRENGISMSLGECPKCDGHSRCYDCDVNSHPASDAEIEEENLKIVRSAGRESPVASSRGQPSFEPESSRGASNVTISSARASRTLSSGQTPSFQRMSSSRAILGTPHRAPLLIRVAVTSENGPVYVLRERDDADLITMWNHTLPSISQDCKSCSRNLVSIHLFRIGKSEESSTPTIIVNTKAPLLEQEKEDIRNAISFQRGPNFFPGTYITSDSIQLVFRQSRLRRSMDTSRADEPPICEPRNRHFNTLPSTGDSIGIAGSVQDTATLGCYLMVGTVPFILTVDHLMPRRSAAYALTHISEQDQRALTVKALDVEIKRLMRVTTHRCHECDPECDTELTERDSDQPSLRAFYLLELLQSGEMPWCVFIQLLEEYYLSPEMPRYRSHVVAQLYLWSGRRSRLVENFRREMDWAIYRVDDAASLHLLPKLLSQHDEVQSDFDNELRAALDIRPGALVVSVGRTSGYQTGKISTTLSSIFHEEYITQEWCVIKREENSVEEWVEGGIGVEGDSGALIVDETTKEIYGMLWGRTGDGAATATIFTPLREIFEDIEWHTQPKVGILRGQHLRRHFGETTSPLPVRGSTPTVPMSVQPLEKDVEQTIEGDALIPSPTMEAQLVASTPTAPISIPLDEKEGFDQRFEQELSSLSLTTQSSTDLLRHLPFKRYRRHSRSASDQDIGLGPAAPRQEREDKVESKSWPGTHTYLRYALGDQG